MFKREVNAPPKIVFKVSRAISFVLPVGGVTSPTMMVDWIEPGRSTR